MYATILVEVVELAAHDRFPTGDAERREGDIDPTIVNAVRPGLWILLVAAFRKRRAAPVDRVGQHAVVRLAIAAIVI